MKKTLLALATVMTFGSTAAIAQQQGQAQGQAQQQMQEETDINDGVVENKMIIKQN